MRDESSLDPASPDGAGPAAAGVPDLLVCGLRKTYGPPPVRALRGVDLTVRAGEFVALMGPSGSGKSTLLHLIAGLDTGRRGHGRPRRPAHRGTQQCPPRPAAAPPRRPGLPVLLPHRAPVGAGERRARRADRRRPAAAAAARTRELLDTLGLLDRAAERPAALSGGERQRVAIARALANRPTLLLADEPTGALDSAGAAEVLDLFGRLHNTGQSILMVTHSREVAAGAERIVRMRDGCIVDDGTGPPAPVDPANSSTAHTMPVRVDALTGRLTAPGWLP